MVITSKYKKSRTVTICYTDSATEREQKLFLSKKAFVEALDGFDWDAKAETFYTEEIDFYSPEGRVMKHDLEEVLQVISDEEVIEKVLLPALQNQE